MKPTLAKITVEWCDDSGRSYTVTVSDQRSVDRTVDFLTELVKEPLRQVQSVRPYPGPIAIR